MNTENNQPPAQAPVEVPKVLNLDQVNDLRERVRQGIEVSREELHAALDFLRQDRITAATTSKKKSTKAVSTPMDLAALFAPKKETP